ncbi:MAG TPA: hypothetical protein VGH28_26500 [Polyangiaceae bacterium]|jgi:hypothetical protein
MPIKRLLDAVVFGFGATAGAKLFEEVDDAVERAAREREEQEARDAKKPPPDPKAQKRAEKKRKREKAQRDAEIEKALAALKRRLR